MNRRFLGTFLVVVLLIAGCNRGGDGSEASPDPSIPASPQLGDDLEPEGSGEEPGTAAPSTPKAGPQPTKGAPRQKGSLVPPAAGAYFTDNSGSETLNCGTPQKTDPPKLTEIRVDPANGSRQRSVADARRADGTGSVSTTILEYRPDGVYLIYLKLEQTVPFLGTNVTEFEPSKPPLVAPNQPKQGEKWSFTMTSKDGDVTVTSNNSIEATSEAVSLGDGSKVTTSRAKATTRVTGTTNFGNMDITTVSTTWASPAHRLVVKDISDTSGTFSTCTVDAHVESILRTTKPSS
jgi:hypothetical protein